MEKQYLQKRNSSANKIQQNKEENTNPPHSMLQMQKQLGNKQMLQLMNNTENTQSEDVIQGVGFLKRISDYISSMFSIDFSDIEIDISEEDIMADLTSHERVDIGDELESVSQDASLDDDLGPIIAEALSEPRLGGQLKEIEYGESAQSSHADIANSKVVIDPEKNKNTAFRKSVLLHEILHFVSDRKYGANQVDGNTAFNIHAQEDEGIGQELIILQTAVHNCSDELDGEEDLFRSVPAEGHMYSQEDVDNLYEYLHRRLVYAEVNAIQEVDTVSSELFYLLKLLSKDHTAIKSSKTYKAIKNLATTRYDVRNA